MRWFEVQDYYASLRPIYLASKVFLVHFSTLDPSIGAARRSLFDVVRLVFTMFSDVYLFTVAIRSLSLYLEVTDSVLLNAGLFASLALNFAFSTMLSMWNSYTDIFMYKLYKNLAICDEELLNFGFAVNHTRHFWTTIFSLCSSMVTVAYILIATIFVPSFVEWLGITRMFSTTLTSLSYARVALVTGCFICQTSMTLLSLRKRFQLLNRALCKYLPTTHQQQPRIPNPKLTSRLIRKFASLHDLLSDTLELYNYCFATKAILIVASCFGITLFSWFGLIHSLTTHADTTTLRMSIANVAYNCLYLTYFFQQVALSSLVNRECHRTVVLLHKAVCYGTFGTRNTRELRCFSQQLWHHVPKVSSRMFVFEWELLYHYAGQLATYLVILIQFDLANINF